MKTENCCEICRKHFSKRQKNPNFDHSFIEISQNAFKSQDKQIVIANVCEQEIILPEINKREPDKYFFECYI